MNYLAIITSKNERSLCKNQWVSLLGSRVFAHYQCICPQITFTEGKRIIWSNMFQKWPHQCDQSSTHIIYKHTHTHTHIRSREMVLMNLFAGQAKRHRQREQTCEQSGEEGVGWAEQHWRMQPAACEAGSQWAAAIRLRKLPRSLWWPSGWDGVGREAAEGGAE